MACGCMYEGDCMLVCFDTCLLVCLPYLSQLLCAATCLSFFFTCYCITYLVHWCLLLRKFLSCMPNLGTLLLNNRNAITVYSQGVTFSHGSETKKTSPNFRVLSFIVLVCVLCSLVLRVSVVTPICRYLDNIKYRVGLQDKNYLRRPKNSHFAGGCQGRS